MPNTIPLNDTFTKAKLSKELKSKDKKDKRDKIEKEIIKAFGITQKELDDKLVEMYDDLVVFHLVKPRAD